jgi:DNA-binding transcriptional LysR family regulator
MDIRKVDLNLLLVFDAMRQHRNVTRAGEALGLSQPAMSAALARLRVLFDDPLFMRTGSQMEPTPRAEQLGVVVQDIVRMIQSEVLQPTLFDPASSSRTFTLLTPDIAEMNFLPRLLERLAKLAPGVNLKTLAMSRHMAATALESGAAELAIGYFPDLHRAGFFQQRLFRTAHVCLLRKQHSHIGERLTLKQFLAASHAVVHPDGRQHVFERYAQERGLRRRVVVELSHFMSLLPIVESSDIIATVPKDLADFFVQHGKVRYVDTPMKSPVIDVHQFWHQRYQKDLAHTWLRKLIHEMFRKDKVE